MRRWRARRAWIIARGNFPMALGALVVGGALGTIVTYFAGYSELAGGPMVVAGLLIGAGAGLTLKVIADHRPPTYPGSWGRFAVVTGAAILGAGSAAVGVLALFWN